ncbi:MAG: AAA family ATPase [Bacteroidetes bacterium]|nr:AAA family ATPase [Bacteroidota bacterium]
MVSKKNNGSRVHNSDGIISSKDLGKLLSIVREYWYVPIVFVILGAGVGYYYFEKFVFKGYTALAQISLKYNPENKKEYADYSEEMTGINSPDLIIKTINSLNLDVSYFTLKDNTSEEVFNNSPFKVTTGVVSESFYETPIALSILDSNSYSISYQGTSNKIEAAGVFDSLLSTNDFKLYINKTKGKESLLKKGEKYIVKLHNKNTLVSRYQSALKSNLTKDLGVLQVFYNDFLSNRAVSFLDTLTKNYLNNTIKTQLERNTKMVYGIDKLLVSTDITLQQIADSLRKYNQGNLVISESIEDQKYISVYTSLTLEKSRLQQKRLGLNEIENYLTLKSSADVTVPPPYFNEQQDAFLANAFAELQKLQKDKRDYLFDVTDKSKNISHIDKGYEDRKSDLLKYIKDSKVATDAKIAFVENQIAEITPLEKKYTSTQLRIMDLERQMKMNENMYMDLLNKKNTLLVSQAAMAPEYKLFESAHIVESSGPSRWSIIYKFALVALGISLLFVYLKMLFTSGIKTIDELKEKTELPILGEIPMIKYDKNKITTIVNAEENPIASVFLRSIRTSLEFMPAKKKAKVILVTSHMIGEGKTFSAINLAEVISKSNKKVLLIDLDLFNPSIVKSLSITTPIEKGVANVYNDYVDISKAILKGDRKFDMLLNTTPIKNASELLIGDRTEKIIEYARKNYDYVILDTAPIGLISEVLSVMKHSDINVFVLSSVVSNKEAIKQANLIVEENKFNIYLLLNKTNVKKTQYYSKYYKNYKYAYAS